MAADNAIPQLVLKT